jgi:hypothetical protein
MDLYNTIYSYAPVSMCIYYIVVVSILVGGEHRVVGGIYSKPAERYNEVFVTKSEKNRRAFF